MIFLFEPYNAYQKPPKKKHWMEIAEEEALLHKIALDEQARQKHTSLVEKVAHEQAITEYIAKEQQAILEAAKQNQNPSNVNNQNIALPQYFPQPASQQVQDGQYAAPAGGGGYANPTEEEETEQANFLATPIISFGPNSLITFINLTPTPSDDTFLWDFGTGSLTSSATTPAPLVYAQTGSYTITLDSISGLGFPSTASRTIIVRDTQLAGTLTVSTSSAVAPFTNSFAVGSGYVGDGTVTGLIIFGDGTSTPYVGDGIYTHIYDTGSFIASLSLIESKFNHYAEFIIASVIGSVPVITPALVADVTTSAAPLNVTFSNNTTYTGHGTLNYLWIFGSGSLTSTAFAPTMSYSSASSYTVSLQVTESTYNIAAVGTRANYLIVT